jgi:hypothetical protein
LKKIKKWFKDKQRKASVELLGELNVYLINTYLVQWSWSAILINEVNFPKNSTLYALKKLNFGKIQRITL